MLMLNVIILLYDCFVFINAALPPWCNLDKFLTIQDIIVSIQEVAFPSLSLLSIILSFVHYILLPWTSLWTKKHWTFCKACANKKGVIKECVYLAAVLQPFCPTERSLDSGAKFVKVIKSNAAVKNVPTAAWNHFYIIFSIFSPTTSFYCEFAVVSMQWELQNKCFFSLPFVNIELNWCESYLQQIYF